MITIKITLDKNEIKSLGNMLIFGVNQIKPDGIRTLCILDCLTNIAKKLHGKMYSQRNKNTVGLSLIEVCYIQAWGDAVYSQMGNYESAVWYRINEELKMKISREIQIRMI